ncbi:hypothetical protein KAK07_07220 [Ideonella sp. 4Y16]|uniref:hypothetical protein n=1 Tax=Ideonella alba TaxID=2824118 RepID=UPI001B39644F|nr:hypothetical protein [Ideonella alba]MBQ0943122.1 hypothetical protein [Ideonella alba]
MPLFVQHLAIFASIVFLHFVLVRPLNFPLTLAPFALVFFLSGTYRLSGLLSDLRAISLITLVLALPMLGALQIGYDGADGIQFLRTYALWCTAAMSILAASLAPASVKADIATPALAALLAITICVALQAITSQNGDRTFFNFFGSHQYFGEIELETLATDDRLRPPGFYLEPSFCAYVITNLTAICLLQDRHRGVSIALGVISILFIQSLTGLIAFGVILLFYTATQQRSQRTINARAVTAALLAAGPFIFLVWFFYADYVASRTAQVDEVGSSTYYRVVGLLPVLSDTLIEYPFGYALGRVREIVPKYLIPHGNGYGESIDNGLYLLIFYFGWIGLIAVFLLIYKFFGLWYRGQAKLALCLLVVLLGSFFNGGIMLPEFALLTTYIIYVARTASQ